MENKRSKVLISILLVVLCLSVCVGLTYAYFTDSAKSSGNKIQAGNLKLDLKLYDKVDDEWISIKNTEDPVFNYKKWEPGYVDAKLLKIENLGDLAMQWEAKLVSAETVSEFANAIEVYVQKSDAEIAYPADRAAALAWTKVGTLDQFINTAEKLANGTFTAQGEAYYIGIALYMPAEITDNTLQGQVLGAFDIQINATQLAYESDAFDENYDADAKLPCDHAATEVILGYPATYEETGLTNGEKCTICGTILTEQEEIPMLVEPDYPYLDFTEIKDDNGDAIAYSVKGSELLFTLALTEDVDIVIPSTYHGLPVTEIGNNAFANSGMLNIKSITIPDSIIVIADEAFSMCAQIPSITIPNRVTYIGAYAFRWCSELRTVVFDGTVAEWKNIQLGEHWLFKCFAFEFIICTDGKVAQDGTVTYN